MISPFGFPCAPVNISTLWFLYNEDETIEEALFRFKQKELYAYKRWTKKRYGYHEKPSVLKRKRKKMARIWSQMEAHGINKPKEKLHLYIGLEELFSRNGSNNAAGK